MNKDFVEVANDSGTNDGSFKVVCERNSGNERSTILTVSGGGVNKTINITQEALNPGSIEVAGGVYASDGTLINLGSFGMEADIKISMNTPQMGRFIFPIPVQGMRRFTGNHSTFLRIRVNEEIPSYYKGEKVVAFLESDSGNEIYTPKKELTIDVYSKLGKNVFDLNIADGITLGNTEIFDINSALHDKANIVILLENNRKIQLINLIWKAVYHES